MNFLRDQLLTGSSLAGDQHANVGGGDLSYAMVDLLHRLTGADHRAKSPRFNDFAETRTIRFKVAQLSLNHK